MSLAITISVGNSITATTNNGKSVGFTSESPLVTYTAPADPEIISTAKSQPSVTITV